MSYIDRLERLTYQSPKRKTFDLEFEDLARNITRKTAINEFPYQNIANVQDLGMGNLKIPIRCFITGINYDLEADRFFKALNEQGYGILDHPRWGSINVLPINITQSESFVDGLGRAIFEIEFAEYFPEATNFPEKIYDLISKIFAIIQGVIDSVFQLIDSVLTIETEVRRIARNLRRIAGSTIAETKRIESRFKGISDRLKEDTKNNFVNTNGKYNIEGRARQDNFNKLLRIFQNYIKDNPGINITEATKKLLEIARLPVSDNINSIQILNSYSNTIDYIDSLFDSNNTMTEYEATLNGLIYIGFTVALCEKLINPAIQTRDDTIYLLDKLYDRNLKVKSIYDKVISKNGNIDYDIILNTYTSISYVQRILLNISLQLPTVKNITLDRDTSPIEFVWSITDSLDRLEELMSYNKLTNDKLLIIPKGTLLRYY